MKVLFVLYESLASNSGIHVHYLAQELSRLGLECVVAVPAGPRRLTGLGAAQYRTVRFSELSRWGRWFAEGGPPDVLHAWTPRERVRTFCAAVTALWPARLIVHLEDNEDAIVERVLLRQGTRPGESRRRVPPTVSHPERYRHFLRSADGVTCITDTLQSFVPAGLPWKLVWPGVDRGRFFPRERDSSLMRRLGVPAHAFVLAYTGNGHAANAHEVASVYRAVLLLKAAGLPAVLLRTGRDVVAISGKAEAERAGAALPLGWVDHTLVPLVMASADLLVQPGCSDEFNDYRLPAKLPEYLASGRPVVLPRANIGRLLVHGQEALVYPVVDGPQIAAAAREVAVNALLTERLSRGAVEFAASHFDWRRSARALEEFYATVCGSRPVTAGAAAPSDQGPATPSGGGTGMASRAP